MRHNKVEGNLLLDYYGTLLTEHQSEVLNDYFKDDLSMQEIAENYGVSKSAISDIINRTVIQLKEYEDKLNLIKQANKLDKIIEELEKDSNINLRYINKLKQLNRG